MIAQKPFHHYKVMSVFKGYQSKAPKPQAPVEPVAEPQPLAAEWGMPVGTEMPDTVVPDTAFAGADSGFGTVATAFDTPAVATRNVLNSDVRIEGILRFTDDLLVDGTVTGEIESDGVLTVGMNAVIRAGEKNKVAVRTRSAIIQGRVTGDVVVTDRVELSETAQLLGDVTAAKISIQDGAVFQGYCKVGVPTPDMLPAEAPAKKGKGSKAAASVDDLLA